MKLKLSAQHDVQILTVAESISPKDVHVLRAGISQLFHHGKNKIVLEIPAGVSFPEEAIREISVLDVLARELSGRIVIASADPTTHKKLDNFARPPLVLSVSTLAEALACFAPVPLDSSKEQPVVAPAAPQAAPAAPVAAAGGEAAAAAFKEEIRARELGDQGTLRKRVAELENENRILQQQLATLVWERRQPADASELLTKVKALEAEVEKLLGSGSGGAAKSK